jgi:hypothetical protein
MPNEPQGAPVDPPYYPTTYYPTPPYRIRRDKATGSTGRTRRLVGDKMVGVAPCTTATVKHNMLLLFAATGFIGNTSHHNGAEGRNHECVKAPRGNRKHYPIPSRQRCSYMYDLAAYAPSNLPTSSALTHTPAIGMAGPQDCRVVRIAAGFAIGAHTAM